MDSVELLGKLISTPSVSRDESKAANLMEQAMRDLGLNPQREANNVWAMTDLDPSKETILLNAHLDTVKPVPSWSRNPFEPTIEGGKLYGLGSNDCGGGLVALLSVFRQLAAKPSLKRNYIYLASAEEEVSGADGIERVLPILPHIDAAIVGEPTSLQPAIAEKGLMVLDITARGKSGHAARQEGVNAIYGMLDDLAWLRTYKFPKVSPLLGPTLMQVTQISAGTQHNVVPDECRIVVDVRTNELYTNEEVFQTVREHCRNEVRARSFRLHSSSISTDHPLVRRCLQLGLTPFGSPTLSDQALMPFPSVKLGPGDSCRSHSADEYIPLADISAAIRLYLDILDE